MTITQRNPEDLEACDFKEPVMLTKEVTAMPNLPMMKAQGHRWMSIFGRVRAHSWGLKLSCGFEMGLIDPISMDHLQP